MRIHAHTQGCHDATTRVRVRTIRVRVRVRVEVEVRIEVRVRVRVSVRARVGGRVRVRVGLGVWEAGVANRFGQDLLWHNHSHTSDWHRSSPG